jgi:DNA-binding transcriptional LysR family regulator
MGHPLSSGRVTVKRYAQGQHILVSFQGMVEIPIDEELRQQGYEREIVTIVDGFATALALARDSDMIASVPEHHTGNLRAGMHTFALPVTVPEFTISMLWHPRLDADPAHRWLRECVREVCTADPAVRRSSLKRRRPDKPA